MPQDPVQSEGRKDNAAQPLGQRKGLISEKGAKRVGKDARKAAGPDGPRAEDVGRTFKPD